MVKDLPDNWVMISLGDIIRKIEAGKNYRCIERPPVGDEIGIVKVSAVSWGQFRQDESKVIQKEEHRDERYLIRSGDLLMSRANTIELVGASVIVGEIQRILQLSDKVLRLRLVDGFEKWVNLYINSRGGRDQIESLSTGAQQSMRNISQDSIRLIALPFPPLNEQRRIVDKIESLFAQLDHGEASLRDVQKLLARYRQSVLKAAVTGELTADWRAENADRMESGSDLLERILQARRENWQGRGKYKKPLAPDTSDLPELPEGWVWTSVDQLHTHLTSGSRAWKKYYGSGDGVFIMAQNVRPMNFDLSEKFSVAPPADSPDAVRSEVRKDDVLITIVGANTGDVCRFPSDEGRHYVCQSVALLRLADAALGPFVEIFLASKGAGRDQLEKFIYGAGRPHLSFEQLRSVVVPIPPLGEQAEIMHRVGEKLDEIKQVEVACQAELTRSAALRQSILKDAFAGKLVPQDPDDEPGSELLARIRTERDDAAPKKRTRKKATA